MISTARWLPSWASSKRGRGSGAAAGSARHELSAAVWQALRAVPPGTTVSYAQIARRLGIPKASRAVGAAIAANPVAVAVPCHRVIRSDGGAVRLSLGCRTQARTARARGPRLVNAVLAESATTSATAPSGCALDVALDACGAAVIPALLNDAQCAQLIDCYASADAFRSRVIMQRHGFGRGEYQYFRYRCPRRCRHCAHGSMSRWRRSPIAGTVCSNARRSIRRRSRSISRSATRRDRLDPRRCCCATRPATTTACTRIFMVSMCFRCRRRAAVGTGSRLRGRRVRADRAAAARAVARRGDTTAPGRCRDLRRASPAGAGNTRNSSSHYAPWGESAPAGHAIHTWSDISRCDVILMVGTSATRAPARDLESRDLLPRNAIERIAPEAVVLPGLQPPMRPCSARMCRP